MRVLKSFVLAFSTYSKIPMPQISCDEEDTKYMMMFFPWIGAIIGALIVGWFYLCQFLGLPAFVRAAVTLLISIVVTGGFHIDGYMDTSDARSSYQPKEKKLEIIKDSHIGAFAVIRVICYILLYLASVYLVEDAKLYLIMALGFVLSRIYSAMAVLTFQNARKSGMLFYTAKTAQRVINIVVLCVELAAVFVAALWIEFWAGALMFVVTILCYLYYRMMSYKVFGGITGDLAGWFVCFHECAIAFVLAVYGVVMPLC